jgi:hypothetical protein
MTVQQVDRSAGGANRSPPLVSIDFDTIDLACNL